MGSILDQCANDAWDVIRGRKKIVGNIIIDTKEEEIEYIEKPETEYGWLSPDGRFYNVEFAKHQTWAAKYIKELYKNGNISIEELRKAGNGNHAGDWLVERGWVLIHNPSQYDIQVTSNGNLTKSQREFLYDFYIKRGDNKKANEIYS